MTASGAGVFRSLRIFNYRVWAAGAFVSNVGTWVQRTAQDLAGAHRAHPSQRLGGRRGDDAAVRAAAPVVCRWSGLAGLLLQPAPAAPWLTQAAQGVFALGSWDSSRCSYVVKLWEVYAFAFLLGRGDGVRRARSPRIRLWSW